MIAKILNPGIIDVVWKDISPFLQDAVDQSAGELSLQNLKQRIEDSSILAICMMDGDTLNAICGIEIVTYPSGKKVLGVVCVGGIEMDSWAGDLDRTLVHLATDQECTEIRAVGRVGWSRFLKNFGWETTHVIASKRI